MKVRQVQSNGDRCIDYTPIADVSAGDVIVVGDMVFVAHLDIAAGVLGALHYGNVYDVPREAATAFSQFQKVYWDEDGDPEGGTAGSGAAVDTPAAGANKTFGYAIASVADEDGNAYVRVASIENAAPQAAAQADSTAETVAAAVSDFNGLLAKLRAAGLLASA